MTLKTEYVAVTDWDGRDITCAQCGETRILYAWYVNTKTGADLCGPECAEEYDEFEN